MNALTRRWAVGYATCAVTFLTIDAVWIGLVAKGMYERQIPHLMSPTLNPIPAGIFYLAFVGGVVHLAVRPAQGQRSSAQRFWDGAILGATAYGTWAFTAAAVLEDFPLPVALADLAWGTGLTGVSAAVAGAIIDRLGGHSDDRHAAGSE